MLPIRWAKQAVNDRRAVLTYWTKRNGSRAYSRKLRAEFEAAVVRIAQNPGIGFETEDEDVRQKVVRDYLLFYSVHGNTLNILSVWDARRNPEEAPFARD